MKSGEKALPGPATVSAVLLNAIPPRERAEVTAIHQIVNPRLQ